MKVLVSDYDGTFFRNKEELLENIEQVKRFRSEGNLFVLATGRTLNETYEELDKYHIPFDYLVLCNGGVIFDKNKNVIKEYVIPMVALQEVEKIKESFEEYIERLTYIHAVGQTYKVENFNYVKIKLRMNDIFKAQEVAMLIDQQSKVTKTYVLDSRVSLRSVESVFYLTDKSVAVKDLMTMLNTNINDVFVVGDHDNDAEMVNRFNGYAIEDSILSNEKKYKVIPSVAALIKRIISAQKL